MTFGRHVALTYMQEDNMFARYAVILVGSDIVQKGCAQLSIV